MAFTGQKTYSPRDIPTPTEFTAWMSAIQAKFTPASGTQDITAADFKWPMLAGGHLNINGNSVTSIPKLGAKYNLAVRRPWQTTLSVFAEVEARGGGSILLPGNTTITAQTDVGGVTGMRVGTNTTFYGHGASSISGQLVMDKKDGVQISDMVITGSSTLTGCGNVTFKRCTFNGTGAHQLKLKDCNNIRILQCNFTGAATEHIRMENISNIRVKGCYFNNFVDLAINVLVTSDKELGLQIANNVFYHPAAYAGTTAYCVKINTTVTGQATATVVSRACLRNQFRGNILTDKTGGLQVGSIEHMKVANNIFEDSSTSATMINNTRPKSVAVKSNGLLISANVISAAKDVGVFLQQTKNAVVCGNVVVSADEALIVDIPNIWGYATSTELRGGSLTTVTGNVFWTADGTIPAMAVWGLAYTPTILRVGCVVSGNHMDGTSARGYRSFINQGTTAGGEIGDTPIATSFTEVRWVFAGNNSQGTTVTGGANEDMKHMAAGATGTAITKSVCLSQTDDSTPINNI